MARDFDFHADPLAQGRITPRALLDATGTISFPFIREALRDKTTILIARLAGAGWFFNIGYTAGKLVIQRNGAQITVDESWCKKHDLPQGCLASWNLDALILSFGDHATHWNYPQIIRKAPFCGPPVELVRWVRQEELTAIENFVDEDQFVRRIHSSLQRFDERLSPVLSGDIFWDIERRRNEVVSKKPKREVDVQAALHAMLVDHMMLSNVDIMPEVRSAAGIVDFLMFSPVAGDSVAKMCVEFKNAHSPDLISGLTTQLRSYMQRLEVRNGAYCVLDYRNAEFDKPSMSTSDLIVELHSADQEHSKWPNRPIKIHWLDVGTVGQ